MVTASLYRGRGSCFSRKMPQIQLSPWQKENRHAHVHTHLHIHTSLHTEILPKPALHPSFPHWAQALYHLKPGVCLLMGARPGILPKGGLVHVKTLRGCRKSETREAMGQGLRLLWPSE